MFGFMVLIIVIGFMYVKLSPFYKDHIDDEVARMADADNQAAAQNFNKAWWNIPKLIIFLGLIWVAARTFKGASEQRPPKYYPP